MPGKYTRVDVEGITESSEDDSSSPSPPPVVVGRDWWPLAALNSAFLFVVVILLAFILRGTTTGGDGNGGGGGGACPGDGLTPPTSAALLAAGGGWRSLALVDTAAPIPLWVHRGSGRIWADVAGVLDADLLLVEQVTVGVGVRGLWDAGSILAQPLVRFAHRSGAVLLTAIQTAHMSSDPAVQPSVERSFAGGVLWAFDAYPSTAEGGTGALPPLWIDLTAWSQRDSLQSGLAVGLTQMTQAKYTIDPARSLLSDQLSKARPTFSCIETALTAVVQQNGALLYRARLALSSLPEPSVVTASLRRSFVLLAPASSNGYTPRAFVQHGGVNQIQWTDEGAPLLRPRTQRVITRHRLDPPRTVSTHESGSDEDLKNQRLVYYLDPGCPTSLRDAILEGVNWWDDAFQAAGFPAGTFQARLAPAGVDLFDIDQTFSAIQWIHRYVARPCF